MKHLTEPFIEWTMKSWLLQFNTGYTLFPNLIIIWHLDSHHKLNRWCFAVYGAIDGFSLTIIYPKCIDNNKLNV